MKALFKNKKAKAGAIVVMAGLMILLMGLSYAWFTSTGSNAGSTITLGDLKVIAEIEDKDLDLVFPGVEYEDQIGFVQLQPGSLAALVKLTFSTEVTIYSDPDGNPLPANEVHTISNPSVVSFTLQENGAMDGSDILAHPLGAWFNVSSTDPLEWGAYIWQYDADGNAYVWIDGYDELHFAYTVSTDGAAMGNEYMNAVIKVAVDWEAVQAIPDGAIEDLFGFTPPYSAFLTDYPGFVTYFDGDPGTIFSPFSFEPALSNAEKIGMMADKLPDGAFKDLLTRIQAGVTD
jgi:hypothetical protein